MEIGQILLSQRVYAAGEGDFKDFLAKLGSYLKDAMPPESAPMNESEYVVPSGFDNSEADQVWGRLGPFVSSGYAQDELRKRLSANGSLVQKFSLENASEVLLNFSDLEMERGNDGSVQVKVPVSSNSTLDYIYYNSTDLKNLFEVWNETAVRYYRVQKQTSFTLLLVDMATGETYNVTLNLFANPHSLEDLATYLRRLFNVSIVIIIPEGEWELRVIVPELRKVFRVIIPGYSEEIEKGPVMRFVEFPSDWCGCAAYHFTVMVRLPHGTSNTGLYASFNLTVGDAVAVEWYVSQCEVNLTDIGARIHVKVKGDSVKVLGESEVRITDPSQRGSFTLWAVKPGRTELEFYTSPCYNPKNPGEWVVSHSHYRTVDVVPGQGPSESTERQTVPEHFEERVAIIPEHEETRTIRIPEHNVSVRVSFTDILSGLELGTEIGGGEPSLGINVTDIESMWDDLDPNRPIIEEKEAAELLNVTVAQLRRGEIPEGYRAELAHVDWVKGEKVLMNSTQFEEFKLRMQEYMRLNNLTDEDFRCDSNVHIDAKRNSKKASETGFAVFIYHPLSVKGSGPLKSIQVKNYAANEVGCELRVSSNFEHNLYFEEEVSTSFNVPSTGSNDILVSSIANHGYRASASLHCGGGTVAQIEFDLEPAESPFWRGFWRGFTAQVAVGGIGMAIGFGVSGGMMLIALGVGAVNPPAGAAIALGAPAILLGSSAVIGLKGAWEKVGQYYRDFEPKCQRMIGAYKNMTETLRACNQTKLADLADGERKSLENLKFTTLADIIPQDLLFLGFGFTDAYILMGWIEANEEQKGESAGKLAGLIARLVITAGVQEALSAITSAENRFPSEDSYLDYLKSTLKLYLTPTVVLAIFAVKDFTSAMATGFAFSSVWAKASRDMGEALNTLREGGEEEIAALGHTGLGSLALKLEEAHTMELLDILARNMEDLGQEKTKDWPGLSEAFLYGMKHARQTDALLAYRLIEWLHDLPLNYAGNKPFRQAVDSLSREGTAEELGADHFIRAWELFSGDPQKFQNLLDTLELAFKLGEQRRSDIMSRVLAEIDSGDAERLGYTTEALGWVAEKRELISDSKRRTRFLDSVLEIESRGQDLNDEERQEILNVLSGLFKDVQTVEKMDERLDKFHNFEDDFLDITGAKSINLELLGECLGRWEIAAPLEEATVTKLQYQYSPEGRDRYYTSAPSGTRYLLTDSDELIPIWTSPEEGKEHGQAVIPKSAVAYLNLEQGDFMVLTGGEPPTNGQVQLSDGKARDIIIPVRRGSTPVIEWNEWFGRTFQGTPYVLGPGEIEWEKLDADNLITSITLKGPRGSTEALVIPQTSEGETYIKTYIPSSVAGPDEFVTFRDPKLVQFEAKEDLVNWLNERGTHLNDKLVTTMARDFRRIMELPVEQGDNILVVENDIGNWGMWRVFQVIYKDVKYYCRNVEIPEVGETDIDYVTVKTELLEVKNWTSDHSYYSGVDKLLTKLGIYKHVVDYGYEDIPKGGKAMLIFYEPLSEKVMNDLSTRLSEKFGDYGSWLTICNGYEDLINEYKP